jgi:hypothetical protein
MVKKSISAWMDKVVVDNVNFIIAVNGRGKNNKKTVLAWPERGRGQ